MKYYIDLFSPETYETFSKSQRNISGFRLRHKKIAEKINIGDRFICYMTKLSRWIGILEVKSKSFEDKKPIFYENDDPFIIRFNVEPIVWLEKNKTIPIHEDEIWNNLSFTKGLDKKAISWTGKVRGSLTELKKEDGFFLEKKIIEQEKNNKTYEVDEDLYKKYLLHRFKADNKIINISIPEKDDENNESDNIEIQIRDSIKMQAILAEIGEKMGMKIWLPKSDRARILNIWKPEDKNILLEALPLNYDEITLKTIEQIDTIWLKGRSIIRAFEVEHTTSIYSGILRMADLLALQPNMDIKLHIVAPLDRKDKVLTEIRRPVFSLLDRNPLYKVCSFLSYDSLESLKKEKHLEYLSDDVLEEYTEGAED